MHRIPSLYYLKSITVKTVIMRNKIRTLQLDIKSVPEKKTAPTLVNGFGGFQLMCLAKKGM